MLKDSSKRRSIKKDFPTQVNPIIETNDSNVRQQIQTIQYSPARLTQIGQDFSSQMKQSMQQQGTLQNQKLQIIARLIPDQEQNFQHYSSQKEEGRQDKCIFKLNQNEIQIIEPTEKKILEEINGFQKRERVVHSPPNQNTGGSNQQNKELYLNKMQKDNQNSTNQQGYDSQMNMKGYNMTPEKEKRDNNKPFQSPLNKIRYLENNSADNKVPNTFTFDNIFEESVSDDTLFNQMRSLYLNCLRKGKNLIFLNLNKRMINDKDNSILKTFINGLQKLKQSSTFNQYVSENAQFFLQSYEIMHPNIEKTFDQQPIQSLSVDDILNKIKTKMSSINRKITQQQCSVYNFQLFDDFKLINEFILIDMNSILDKKPSSSQQQFQNYNQYCIDLLNILNFQSGEVNPSDQFQSLLLQKYKLSDELLILANFQVMQPHITQNYYLLRYTQMLFKNKPYLESMFIKFCLIQNEQIHKILISDNSSELSIKDEFRALSQKNLKFKDEIKVLTSDLINYQELNQQLTIKNKQLMKELQDSIEKIEQQEQNLAAKKKKIKEQSTTIDGMKKNFGFLENFDKSMMADSKNKSFIHANFNSSKKTKDEVIQISRSTQADIKMPENSQSNLNMLQQDQNKTQICQRCQMQNDQVYQNQIEYSSQNNYNKKQLNNYYGQINSELEQEMSQHDEYDKENEITPNRYLSHLDDILSNMESKRSLFSPSNVQLANIAYLENQQYKERLIIKDQDIQILRQQNKELEQQFDNLNFNITQLENKRKGDLQIIEKLQFIFEKKLINFYENEIKEMKNIIEFGFVSMHSEINGLNRDIKESDQKRDLQVSLIVKKTDEVIKQLENKIKIKNDQIKQFQEVIVQFKPSK